MLDFPNISIPVVCSVDTIRAGPPASTMRAETISKKKRLIAALHLS